MPNKIRTSQTAAHAADLRREAHQRERARVLASLVAVPERITASTGPRR
jgi:hypothetical protein